MQGGSAYPDLLSRLGSAPFLVSKAITSWWPSFAALWRGVLPLLLDAFAFTPRLRRSFTMERWPRSAAKCRGVKPRLLQALMSAPNEMSFLAIVGFPHHPFSLSVTE